MYVLPIGVNTDCRKPQFTARFSEKEIIKLTDEARGVEKAAGLPQLYTLLKYADEIGGKVARFADKNFSDSPLKVSTKKVLDIDGRTKLVADKGWESSFSVLKRFLVGEKSTMDMIKMPEHIFEHEWWKNRKVTVDDVKKLALKI